MVVQRRNLVNGVMMIKIIYKLNFVFFYYGIVYHNKTCTETENHAIVLKKIIIV